MSNGPFHLLAVYLGNTLPETVLVRREQSSHDERITCERLCVSAGKFHADDIAILPARCKDAAALHLREYALYNNDAFDVFAQSSTLT